MKIAIFVNEATQVSRLQEYLNSLEHNELIVFACGADIEFLLDEKNISYRSAKALRTLSPSARLILAKELGIETLQRNEMEFFSHKTIHIGKLFTPGLQYFLSHFLYFFDISISALSEDFDRAVVFLSATTDEPIAGNPLDLMQINAFVDGVRVVCEKRRIPLTEVPILERHNRINVWFQRQRFILTRILFHYGMQLFNLTVRIVVPKKKIRILASEHWKNIAPLLQELLESELVLMDRSEVTKIGLRASIQNRMQFVHSSDFLSSSDKRDAQKKSEAFKKEWRKVTEDSLFLENTVFRDYSLRSTLVTATERFLAEGERAVRDIDGTWRMLTELTPDVVLVRAGTSAQIHFSLLCEVARLLSIPSLEIQHGLMSMCEEDFTRDPSAEYIAEYGPLIRKEYLKYNYAPRSTCIDIGSPRFDEYVGQSERQKGDTTTILHIGPAMAPSSWNDTYDVCEYFKTTASAVRPLRNIAVIIKLRSNRVDEPFYREAVRRAYDGIPHRIVIHEPIARLLRESDIVVSCHSTVVIEALMSHCPVVLDASLPIYNKLVSVDFEPHRVAGALLVATNQTDLTSTLTRLVTEAGERSQLVSRAEKFMNEEYLLHDGKSSVRLADTVRTLAGAK